MKKNRNTRRTGALIRLEEQLVRGTKKVQHEEVKLTDKNIKRINKEIVKLETKIKRHG
jgi:low affinity Fe/Cu permease